MNGRRVCAYALMVLERDLYIAGVTNIRPVGQNQPSKNSNPSHSMALENVKEDVNFKF